MARGVRRRKTVKKLGNLIIISGPSGVGKSTLIKKVRESMPDLQFSISCTTRQPRAGEVNGRDYYFLSDAEFSSRLAAGEFLEHATVFKHSYGTLRSEVVSRLARGEEVLLDIDVQGAKQIRQAAETDPEIARAACFVIIAPPDLETLRHRLCNRNSETPEQLQLRLDGAINELKNFRIYDFMVVNDDLDRAAEELKSVFQAVRLRTKNICGEPF